MATFTSQIFEILTLNGDNVGSSVTNTINDINYVDNRILSIPTGSITTLFSMDSVPGAGTFVSSSVQYVRVTNNSATVPVKLIISSSTQAMSYLISAGSSYMISTSKMTGSVDSSSFNFDDIKSVKAQPTGSATSIEYYIATT
jgi:hypothetical protein